MEKEIKARYRNKLSKIIIEVWNGEKWLYVKTLSDPLKEFQGECLAKVSQNTSKKAEINHQKFSYEILNEPQNKDTIAIISGKEKAGMSKASVSIKELIEEQNKIMKDIL